jgi:hypothetical protein
LRPGEAVNTPRGRIGAKYFSHSKAADVGVNACAKLHTNDRIRVKFFRKNKNYDSAETRIPSAFPHRIDCCADNRESGKFFVAVLRRRYGCTSRANAGRRGYTQNLVE